MKKITEDVQRELAALAEMSDEDIDYSDIPDTSDQDWSGAVRGRFYLPHDGNDSQPISTRRDAGSDLTINEAAHFLNVSEPYMFSLLDEEKLPFHQVGTDRRVTLQDATAYKDHQDAEAEAALRELAVQAQELKMGY